VVLLGSVGALAGAWLAPQLGYGNGELIMPAAIGALTALGLGALLLGPRR
jgi:uncharacterized membrane protein YeaQ/YmgE (transglycosylase-associated protein family)